MVSSSTEKRFGRYRLLEKLAEGGMAEIFRAKSIGAHGFEKPLILKCILPDLAEDEDFVRMFIDEAKVTVRLSHPKVVQVLDFGKEEGRYFIAMEYVKGIDCLALLRKCAHLRLRPTTGIAVHIAAEVLDALDYAHNLSDEEGRPLGILHRDISPSNIFLSSLGEVKLGDFGIAITTTAKAEGVVKRMKGKYGYMAPELVTGTSTDRRSDLFSVGVVLAELLMIRRMYIAKSELEVLLQVRDANLRRLDKYGKHIPDGLRTILESALTQDPENRYQDAAAFRDALHRYLFDNRLMVHGHDVRQFIERLERLEGEEQDADAAAPAGELPAIETPAAKTPETPSTDRTPMADGKTPQTEYVKQTGERVCVLPGATLRRDEEPEPRQTPPQRTPERTPERTPTERRVLGHKRKITIGPPPRPTPVPSSLPDTGDAPRIETGDALASVSEVEGTGTGSLHDFRKRESDERPVPKLDVPPAPDPEKAQRVAAERISGRLPAFTPALEGDLEQRSVVAVLFQLAVEEETGLLVLESEGTVKEIYLVNGDPEQVASNLPGELLGQYLVEKGAITEGELAMALAMLPHFDGMLGGTLVGLRLLRPMEVLRHLTHQVRQKLIDALGWDRGRYTYFEGHRSEQENAPLGLDAFAMIGAGVLALSMEAVERRLGSVWDQHLQAVPGAVPPEVFRLGAEARSLYNKLDGRHTLREVAERYDNQEQRDLFLRVTYLLTETGLVAAT